jgi:type VI secretion system protein
MEERLLERLMRAQKGEKQAEGSSLSRHVASIGHYLGLLLNTKQGNSQANPDLGMPDLTNFAHFGGAEVESLEAVMSSTISRYEPRLHNVEVHYVPEQNTTFDMAFSLSANILHEGTFIPVLFETILLPDGRIEIRGYA